MAKTPEEQQGLDTERYQMPRVIRNISEPKYYVGHVGPEKLSPKVTRMEFGMSPFGPPPEYFKILDKLYRSGALAAAGLTYLSDPSPAIAHVRKRFGLGPDPYISISSEASDEIAERINTQFIDIRSTSGLTKVIGPPYQYLHVLNFLDRHRLSDRDGNRLKQQRILHETFRSNITFSTPYETVIRSMTEKLDNRKRNIILYITNPNSPTGDVASLEAIEELISMFASKPERAVFIDEAFGDAVETKNSAIPLTEKYPNLGVIRSLSKSIGLPGLKIGYVVMSAELGEQYRKIERIHAESGIPQLIANELMKPDILERHLAIVREKTVAIKRELLRLLRENHIRYFQTDERVPILLLDGESPGFYDKLKDQYLELTTGFAPYRNNVPWDEPWYDYELHQKGRCVRMVIPQNSSTLPKLVKKITRAKDMK